MPAIKRIEKDTPPEKVCLHSGEVYAVDNTTINPPSYRLGTRLMSALFTSSRMSHIVPVLERHNFPPPTCPVCFLIFFFWNVHNHDQDDNGESWHPGAGGGDRHHRDARQPAKLLPLSVSPRPAQRRPGHHLRRASARRCSGGRRRCQR